MPVEWFGDGRWNAPGALAEASQGLGRLRQAAGYMGGGSIPFMAMLGENSPACSS